MTDGFPDAYAELVQRVFAGWQQGGPVTQSVRRGRSGVAGGDRPVMPDAASRRRRCGRGG